MRYGAGFGDGESGGFPRGGDLGKVVKACRGAKVESVAAAVPAILAAAPGAVWFISITNLADSNSIPVVVGLGLLARSQK